MTIPPHYHLVMGGFAFGTVFMATDPVSAAGNAGGPSVVRILYRYALRVDSRRQSRLP